MSKEEREEIITPQTTVKVIRGRDRVKRIRNFIPMSTEHAKFELKKRAKSKLNGSVSEVNDKINKLKKQVPLKDRRGGSVNVAKINSGILSGTRNRRQRDRKKRERMHPNVRKENKNNNVRVKGKTRFERRDNAKDIMQKEIVDGGKDLGDVEFVTTLDQTIAQRSTIPIGVPVDLAAVINLGATWAAFFMSQYIGMTDEDTVVSTDIGTMGTLYVVAATIAADLVWAMQGQISIFAYAPEAYWELRAALNPKMAGDLEYTWVFADTTNPGQVYGVGGALVFYPLVVGDAFNLSWPTAVGYPNTLLNSTIPALTDELIQNIGPGIVTQFWATLALKTTPEGPVKEQEKRLESQFKLEPVGTPSEFDKSVAAFAYTTAINQGQNVQWSTAYHELKIPGSEWWLVFFRDGFCYRRCY
jgi:hypothetical protein